MHMVRREFSIKAGLKGMKVTQTVTMAGGQTTEWHTEVYWVPLKKEDRMIVWVQASAFDHITLPYCRWK